MTQKQIIFNARIEPGQAPAPIEIQFNWENVKEMASKNGVISGNALAKEAGIATPNLYENAAGQTFPNVVTLCRYMSGAGRTLEQIKKTTLEELLNFIVLESEAV